MRASTSSASNHQQWLQVAEDAAREAGSLLLRERKQLSRVIEEDASDVKLAADFEAEKCIRQRLGRATSLPVIGEEGGGDHDLPDRYEPYWVVDPLDGTANYLRGVPICCVSIGLMRGETPVLGAIYDFHRDILYSAIVAEGLRINGDPVTPSWARSMDLATLQTGIPAYYEKNDASVQAFLDQVQSFRKIRLLGSAALALAYVAAGHFDAYFEPGIRLWDIAAGLALVQAAGGVVRMSRAESTLPFSYNVWAAGRPEFLP